MAVSLLAGSAQTTVWSARPSASVDPAGDDAGHVLKRVDLTEDELADGDAGPAEDLLVGAALQQAMAYRSIGWAPIVDLGTHGTDAYYVAERFPRSAQSLVDADRRVTSAELRTLVVAVVDALIELQVHYDRPHANLKPTNVLIGRRIRPGMICLADPAAEGAHVPSLTRAPDPRAIGRLIFALVTGRPHSAARWPLEFDADWVALGASGREWFDLCQSLVHPLGEASPDLDELMTQVVSIRPSWRRARRAVRVAALVGSVGLAAGLAREPLARWVAAADRRIHSWVRPAPVARQPPYRPASLAPGEFGLASTSPAGLHPPP